MPLPGERLTFSIVVKGKTAPEQSKTVLKRSREDVASTMLHEAVNGYSVVFTGGTLRSDANLLFLSSSSHYVKFKKLPDIASLYRLYDTNKKDPQRSCVLEILC